jgi:hypothetical protein
MPGFCRPRSGSPNWPNSFRISCVFLFVISYSSPGTAVFIYLRFIKIQFFTVSFKVLRPVALPYPCIIFSNPPERPPRRLLISPSSSLSASAEESGGCAMSIVLSTSSYLVCDSIPRSAFTVSLIFFTDFGRMNTVLSPASVPSTDASLILSIISATP